MQIAAAITEELEDVSEAKDGGRLLTTVNLCGADHHLELIRVAVVGGKQAAEQPYRDDYEQLQALADVTEFESFEVPGYPGRYVAYMTPYSA